MLKRTSLFLGGLVLVVPLVVQAQVHEFTLDNGMKVLVKEDNRAPIVVSQVWYKVGSSYEYSGITGISHVLEHMMFKGTTKHEAGEFSRIIAANGGDDNAFTGQDYTAYFQKLEKSRLPISFELEADRMRNCTLPEDEFQKERDVVIEERRLRTEDKPRSLTLEQFYATAFVTSPYQQPIIGWMDDLKNLDVDDVRDWYQRWYAPNNATLVVVGDVDAQAVLALAKQYFEALPVEDITPVKPRLETEQLGLRRITVKAPAKLPYLLMGYKVPVLNTSEQEWEPYALEMLAAVLSGSNSARLPREMVRDQQLAASASSSYDMFSRLDDLFIFDAIPAEGHNVEEVEKALLEQIHKLKTEVVSQEELERIKAQVVADKVYEQDSAFYQAMQLGMLETIGIGWQKLDEYPEKIRAVTAEQIQAVANKYLVENQLTVAVLDPQAVEDSQAANN